MEKYRSLFIEKLKEKLGILSKAAQTTDNEASQKNLIRMYHNIKSDAGMMKYSEMAQIARKMEALLNAAHDNLIPFPVIKPVIKATFEYYDKFCKNPDNYNVGTDIALRIIREIDLLLERLPENYISE